MVNTIAVVLLGTVASAWDIRTRRIPNALTFGAPIVALVVHLSLDGMSGGIEHARRLGARTRPVSSTLRARRYGRGRCQVVSGVRRMDGTVERPPNRAGRGRDRRSAGPRAGPITQLHEPGVREHVVVAGLLENGRPSTAPDINAGQSTRGAEVGLCDSDQPRSGCRSVAAVTVVWERPFLLSPRLRSTA